MNRAIIIMLLLASSLAAQQYERKNLNAEPGQTISIVLPQEAGVRWEARVVTRSILSMEQSEKDGSILIEIQAKEKGLGRLEVVKIQANRVVERVYYFITVGAVSDVPGENPDAPDTGVLPEQPAASGADEEFRHLRNSFDSGYHREALRQFRALAARYPQHPLVSELPLYEGMALYARNQFGEAAAVFTPLAGGAASSLQARASLWLGKTRESMGKYDEAEDAYLDAMVGTQAPAVDLMARNALALVYARNRKLELARAEFERLFSLYGADSAGPAYLTALYTAGRFYESYPGVRDINKSYAYYRAFIQGAATHLASADASLQSSVEMAKNLKEAELRAEYLRKNYIEYR